MLQVKSPLELVLLQLLMEQVVAMPIIKIN